MNLTGKQEAVLRSEGVEWEVEWYPLLRKLDMDRLDD